MIHKSQYTNCFFLTPRHNLVCVKILSSRSTYCMWFTIGRKTSFHDYWQCIYKRHLINYSILPRTLIMWQFRTPSLSLREWNSLWVELEACKSLMCSRTHSVLFDRYDSHMNNYEIVTNFEIVRQSGCIFKVVSWINRWFYRGETRMFLRSEVLSIDTKN